MRIGLSTDISTRDGTTDKDAILKNCFVEVDGDQSVVVKRPAVNSPLSTASGTAQGGFVGREINSYATLNPLDKSANISLVDGGNLTVTNSVGLGCIKANIGKSSGKWYFEITRVSGTNNTGTNKIGDVGFCSLGSSTAGYVYENANAYSILYFDWSTYDDLWAGLNGSLTDLGYTGQIDAENQVGATKTTMGIYINFDVFNIKIGCQNIFGDIGWESVSYSELVGEVYPAISVKSDDVVTVNFGSSPFILPIPSGYNSGWYVNRSDTNELRTYVVAGDVMRSYNVNGKLLQEITL